MISLIWKKYPDAQRWELNHNGYTIAYIIKSDFHMNKFYWQVLYSQFHNAIINGSYSNSVKDAKNIIAEILRNHCLLIDEDSPLVVMT